MMIGKNILLRKTENADLQNFRSWFIDRTYIKALSGSLSQQALEEKLNLILEENSKLYGSEQYFLIEDKKNEALGFLLFSFIHWRNKNLSLEIFLKPEKQNKFYGMEAIILGLLYAFSHLNMHKVSMFINEFNENALGIAQKTAVLEGKLGKQAFYDGRYWDVLVFGILKDEFEKQKEKAVRLGYGYVATNQYF